jgi:hypothetical protein
MKNKQFSTSRKIIKKAKWYMNRKDYEGLRLYLDEEEKNIENHQKISKNKEAEYIDTLIKKLD